MLVGCELTRQTQAGKNYIYENKIMEEALAKSNKCWQETEEKHAEATTYVADNILVMKEKDYLKIYTKDKYKLLTSTRFFEERDKAFLIEYLNAHEPCINKTFDDYAKIDYRWTLFFREAVDGKNQLFVDFMLQKINVALLNKKSKEHGIKMDKNWNRLYQQKHKEGEKAHYAEIRQYKKQRMDWAGVFKKLGESYNKTTITNCQVSGHTVNCQSY